MIKLLFMKTTILCIFILFSLNKIIAQNIIKNFSTTSNIEYSLSSNKISFNKQKNTKANLNLNNRFNINTIKIEHGDLIINYDVFAFPKKEKGMYIQLELVAYDTLTSYQWFAPPQHLGNQVQINYTPISQEKKIIWENWVEQVKPSDKFIKLELIGYLMSNQMIDCKIPSWGKKQKKPHFLGGGVGLSLFLASFYFQEQTKKEINAYIKQTERQDFIEATKTYGSLNNKNKTDKFLKYSGLTLLASSVISGTIRFVDYKRKKEAYNYYCHPNSSNISFQPNIKLNGQINDHVGVTLFYTF